MNRLFNQGLNDQQKWDAFIDLTIDLERKATKGNTVPLPLGQMPTPEIDAECGEWLEHALTSPDPSYAIRKTPDHLRPWVAARMLVANWYAMSIAEKGAEFIGGTYLETLRIFTLIGWSDHLRGVWARFYYDEMGTLICGARVEKAESTPPSSTPATRETTDDTIESDELEEDFDDEEDDGIESWDDLYEVTEMLLVVVSDKGKIRFPTGKMPTPEMNSACDEAFETFFNAFDPRIILDAPDHVRPWMGARLAVALLVIEGASMQDAPFPEDRSSVLYNLVMKDWHGSLGELWPKFFYGKKGKLEFRYEGNEGAAFKPN